MNILKSGGTLFLAYEGRMGRANPTPTPRKSEWEYIVQIEVPNTSECQEGVPSQGPVAFDAPES